MTSRIADILLKYLPQIGGRDRDLLVRELTAIEQNSFAVGTRSGVRGEVASLRAGNVSIDYADGITLRNPSTGARSVYLDAGGDAFFGKDIDTPADGSLSIFSNAQPYNNEDMGDGDVLLGDNSSGKANMLWDRSEGTLLFRGGQISRVWIHTDGTLRAGAGVVQLDEGGVYLWNSSTVPWKCTLRLDPFGNSYFGSDITAPATTSLAVFGRDATYNSESMTAGDMLVGDNSSGKANMLWDRSAGQLKFRGGTTVHAYIDTNGKLTAGGGAVTLDSTGITATAGTIAGWSITPTEIKKTGIILDSSADKILVGSGTPRLEIDGGNKRIRSSTYAAGAAGFNINGATGDAEFNNLRARGELASAVFKKNEVAATAGTLGVFYSASTLYADYTTPSAIGGSNSLDAKNTDDGNMLFEINDIIRLKAWNGSAFVDAWLKVTYRTNNSGTYATYIVQLMSGSTSVSFKKGTAIADYGQSTAGFLTLSADGVYGASANMSIYSHDGSPWSATTLRARIGNLYGEYGAGSNNRYGIGIGNYNNGNGNYLSYNAEGDGVFVLKAGSGKVKLSADGLEFLDTQTDVTKIRWYYYYNGANRVVGRVMGDYGGTGAGAMWVSSLRASGDPWTSADTIIVSTDSVAGTQSRIDVRSTGSIGVIGSLDMEVDGKPIAFWEDASGDLMADVVTQYADSTSKLWIRAWRQSGDSWTGSSILLRAKDDVAGTEGALNINSSGDISTVAWTEYGGSSTVVGWSSFGNKIIKYMRIGKLVFVHFYIDGTSNSTSTSFTLPYAVSLGLTCVFGVVDNGQWSAGRMTISSGSSTATFSKDVAGNAWTASGSKGIYGEFWYRIS